MSAVRKARITSTKPMHFRSLPSLFLLAPEEAGDTIEALAELIAEHHTIVDGIGLLSLVDIFLYHRILRRWRDQHLPLAGNARFALTNLSTKLGTLLLKSGLGIRILLFHIVMINYRSYIERQY